MTADLYARKFTETGSRCHRNDGSPRFCHWAAQELPETVRLLACGPDAMMQAVAQVARDRDLDCWLSLETYMGCGVGICNGCAVMTEPEGELGDWPVAKCCVDGPVFPARAIRL